MPSGTPSDAGAPPTIPLSFSNNFWGRDDAGVDPLLSRMQNAKTTCDELKTFYSARAALEDEYARKLFALCRKPLGSTETGTLRASLDVARGETELMGKQHALIAQQMKSELEEPLAAFSGGMKERRKIVQAGIERLLKTKQAQTAQVNKSRDKYEQDCLRVKGYLAQGHMVMGQEERKNKAKLEKTQINMATNSNDYEAAIKVLEETTGRWNKEWKAACDKFQDLEEERLDFTKSSLWTFANIASTVCVSDDASCEKIRLSLENCEVEKDIMGFIKTSGTGQEIPDPPRYINFCRGDVDSASEASEDDNYSVAQFQRTTKPEFRSSSPGHSTTGSQYNPQSELSQRMSEGGAPLEEEDDFTPSKTNSGRPAPLNFRQQDPNVPPNYSPSQHGDLASVPHNEYPTEGMTMFCRTGPPSITGSGLSSNTRPSSRDSQSDYSNPTSYTTADPMSGKNSPTKGMPPAGGVGLPGMTSSSPDKSIQKKRSAFFTNSPFRRKSKKEADHQAHTPSSNRSTWNPSSTSSRINLTPSNMSSTVSQQSSPTRQSPSRQQQNLFNRDPAPEGEEPADPRASFQLNIGPNLLDVASPDSQSTPRPSLNNRRGFPGSSAGSTIGTNNDDLSLDPIAQALADLKQSSNSNSGSALAMAKQATSRVQADRYHGVQTPAPDSRPLPISAQSADRLAAQRGTPPPAYDNFGGSPVKNANPPPSALGVPPPAFTSREMRARTDNWGTGSNAGGTRPGAREREGNVRSRSPGPGNVRAASPSPQHQMRARSPGPGMMQPSQNQNMRARSPAPGIMQSQPQNPNMRARSPAPSMMQSQPQQYSPNSGPYPQIGRPRGQSQAPQSRPGVTSRQGSGMEIQLSSSDVQRYSGDQQGSGSGRSRNGMMNTRPASVYGGDVYQQQQGQGPAGFDGHSRGGMMDSQMRRERSKSMAAMPMHYARALYSYTAAIPEELSFAKGDILAVLRLQDDGWWEAEISKSVKGASGPGMGRAVGLVPSNYLQRC